MIDADKKFIIVGDKNAITYKEFFPLMKDGKVWIGYESPKDFIQPNTDEKKVMTGLTRWFTNVDLQKIHEKLIGLNMQDLIDKGVEFPKYDNYDAIEVSRVKNIPMDYDGVMGVPITFLNYYNSDQFEIVGLDRYTVPKEYLVGGRVAINGKPCYARILIRHRKDENGKLI